MGSAANRQAAFARLVAVLLVALVLVGAAWYGISWEVHGRVWRNLIDRPGGPLAFRFMLQPCIATVMAFLDGAKDARLGRSPYFWTVITDPTRRAKRLREGLISTARVIFMGLCMDAIYQLTELKTFYPGEAVIIALALAFVPYLLLRGPFARVMRWRLGAKTGGLHLDERRRRGRCWKPAGVPQTKTNGRRKRGRWTMPTSFEVKARLPTISRGCARDSRSSEP